MRTTTLLFSLLLITGSSAQPILRRPPTIGVGLEVGSPIGAFDDTWGREMAGLSGNFTAPMGVLPFDWGLDVGWARMGSARDVVAVNEENLEATTGDIKVNSNIYSYHAQLRLKPFNGKVSPYIEAMAARANSPPGRRSMSTAWTSPCVRNAMQAPSPGAPAGPLACRLQLARSSTSKAVSNGSTAVR